MVENEAVDVLTIFHLNSSVEHGSLECKEARGGLPKSIWDTYSAFANTEGGVILLGIKEEPKGKFSVSGISNPQEMINLFWTQCSNPNIVSINILSYTDVRILNDISGSKIIMVTVPPARIDQKPVYINKNIELSFIRRGESDDKAKKEELEALIRNARNPLDTPLLVDFSINDLDIPSISAFKSIVSSRFPKKEYDKQNIEDFLIELGFYGQDRRAQNFYPKQGCLLLFGKYNSIKDVFPSYHLDYLDYRNSTSRWSDRVASDMPYEQEMNLFNFFNIVYNKLLATDNNSFELDENNVRVERSLTTAIREALVNMIVHTDYEMSGGSLKIEVYDDHYTFRNPGKMLVSIEEYERGGVSICRNDIIMKAFRYLGYSERQGMGGKEIVSVAMRNKLMLPDIATNLMFTEIKFWKIDAASYPDLSDEEQAILRQLLKTINPLSKSDLKEAFPGYTEYRIRATLESLMQKERIRSIGRGKATRYVVNFSSREAKWNLQKMLSKLSDLINILS